MIIDIENKREYQCQLLDQFQPAIFGSDIIVRHFMWQALWSDSFLWWWCGEPSGMAAWHNPKYWPQKMSLNSTYMAYFS